MFSCGHGRVGHETAGVVGETVSAMALVNCRSVKLLPFLFLCVCVIDQ